MDRGNMFANIIPLFFCISLALGAILAWVKSEKKYQQQREKILEHAQELRTTLNSIRKIQSESATSNSSEKGHYSLIKQIASVLDSAKDKTTEEIKIEKMIKREFSEIALALLTNSGAPEKRNTKESEEVFQRMKREI